jgi:hypothetical protein
LKFFPYQPIRSAKLDESSRSLNLDKLSNCELCSTVAEGDFQDGSGDRVRAWLFVLVSVADTWMCRAPEVQFLEAGDHYFGICLLAGRIA